MPDSNDLSELHWLLAIVQSIDVGVVVLDREYRIDVWNTFMENRSGRLPEEARKKTFFELFPEVDEQWFRRKVENVATLGTPSFTIWEQRPYLLRFKNYQPITGLEDFMYQNTTLMPLKALNGSIEQVCLIIYDVTDVATNRRQLQAANQELQRLSSTDRLTGLFNRGHWEEMLRDADIAGRYGGEEFVVLLPDTDSEGAVTFAERLRQSIEAHEVVHEGRSIRFTVSLGIADLSEPTNGYAQLIERADIALYSSKASGRNQVTLYR
jgi:GGDEF domain-containing protein